jgi:hypothetical protein
MTKINSENILQAIGQVSDEKIAEADTNTLETPKTVITIWKILTPLAAACLVMVVAVFAITMSSDKPYSGLKTYDLSNTAIAGLPVDNFCLSEIGSAVIHDRLAYSKMHDFFQVNPPRAFVFVRVLDVNQESDNSFSVMRTIQTSTVQVLSTIWNYGAELPQVISVNQHGYGVGISDGYNSIFLREGGVYLLPLDSSDWEGNEWWYVMGDNDVLFEVDDNGKIWTHSPFAEFNKFDGEEASAVADAIISLTSDDNFGIATSAFGRTFRWDYSLEEVVYGETEGITWEGDFVKGKRYLALITEGNTVYDFYAVAVDSDGIITNTGGNSVFSEFAGFTVQEVSELAEKARAWHGLI